MPQSSFEGQQSGKRALRLRVRDQVALEYVGSAEMTKNLAAFAIFPFALAYSGITAPFRGADEYNHFFRAYHVSIGRMTAHHAAFGVVGEELPASLLTLARAAADFPRLPSIASSS